MIDENVWAHLADSEGYGRPSKKVDHVEIAFSEAQKLTGYKHGGHAMIWAPDPDHKVFDLYSSRAQILMQMRFDGLLGFPGGLIDPGEDVITGVNRELREEIRLDPKFDLTHADHVASHRDDGKNLVLHFFTKKVTLEEFREIEKDVLSAEEYGAEVLGPVRVPLYTMGDNLRGLPMFLLNQFAGNARGQLLTSVESLGILTKHEIAEAVRAAENFDKK
ncbi:U8 snoRNA-decapping enzyme-like [Tubulanus polymorphus]|uniref:U8 snoRNA-decapping enzyme-like n=1 Tax=Tubulanus polymorphus TaxID=672921 RepID=UPI003DA4A9BB